MFVDFSIFRISLLFESEASVGCVPRTINCRYCRLGTRKGLPLSFDTKKFAVVNPEWWANKKTFAHPTWLFFWFPRASTHRYT